MNHCDIHRWLLTVYDTVIYKKYRYHHISLILSIWSTGWYFIQRKIYFVVFRMFSFLTSFVLCTFKSLCGYGITLFSSFRGNYTFELFHLYRICFMLGICRWYMYQINIKTFIYGKEFCVHSPVICAIILLDAHILSKPLYAR